LNGPRLVVGEDVRVPEFTRNAGGYVVALRSETGVAMVIS